MQQLETAVITELESKLDAKVQAQDASVLETLDRVRSFRINSIKRSPFRAGAWSASTIDADEND
jgi:hypothetical protein